MPIPAKVAGFGQTTARNVFRVTFSQALSAPPTLEAYDSGAFPAVSTSYGTVDPAFTGTPGNGLKPMFSLIATTSAAPGAANWAPVTATYGAANPNKLKGNQNYVVDPTTPGAGGSITFNTNLEIPADIPPTANMAADLIIRYSYAGTEPTLTWAFNDAGAGGTEEVPVWTTFTPGINGLRYCDTGTVAGGPYELTIPANGTINAAEAWVTT